MADFGTHVAILQLVIGYTLVGAFVFTVIVTCLSLVGLVKFANPGQQKALFGTLILELAVIGVAFFSDLIILEPGRAVAQVTAPIERARAEAEAERDVAVDTLGAVFERIDAAQRPAMAGSARRDGAALAQLVRDLDAMRPQWLDGSGQQGAAGETVE